MQSPLNNESLSSGYGMKGHCPGKYKSIWRGKILLTNKKEKEMGETKKRI